ncbi:hypothetical protein Bca52824_042770 [Brassica carinata]|uniref:Uncharacterized protein n=1 Tax=Brassica carinata TaxID=52824 RepID=A0A8X7V014_BRACI|nr:hypothetical protein Bca52824_042770 [Brassica carinata]
MTAELSDTSRSGTQVAFPELVMPGFPGAHSTEERRAKGVVGGGETERSNRGRRRSRGGEPERAERWFWGVVVVGEEIDREDEGWRLDVMVMTSGDQEILLSLEHDSQGFTIARAGDNVAIAFQETDAYQVMSREENALAGNQFHKMLSMLGESESKVDNP